MLKEGILLFIQAFGEIGALRLLHFFFIIILYTWIALRVGSKCEELP